MQGPSYTWAQLQASPCFTCRDYADVLRRRTLGEKDDYPNLPHVDADESSAAEEGARAAASPPADAEAGATHEVDAKEAMRKLEETPVSVSLQLVLRHILSAPMLYYAVPAKGYSSIARGYITEYAFRGFNRGDEVEGVARARVLREWMEQHDRREPGAPGLLPAEVELSQRVIRGHLILDDTSYYPREALSYFVQTVVARLLDRVDDGFQARVRAFVEGLRARCTEAPPEEGASRKRGPEGAPKSGAYLTGSDLFFEVLETRMRLCIPFTRTSMTPAYSDRAPRVRHDAEHTRSDSTFQQFYMDPRLLRKLFPGRAFHDVPAKRSYRQSLEQFRALTSDEAKETKAKDEEAQREKWRKEFPLIHVATSARSILDVEVRREAWGGGAFEHYWSPAKDQALAAAAEHDGVYPHVTALFHAQEHEEQHFPLRVEGERPPPVPLAELMQESPLQSSAFLRRMRGAARYLQQEATKWGEEADRLEEAEKKLPRAARVDPDRKRVPRPPTVPLKFASDRCRHASQCYALAHLLARCLRDNRFHLGVQRLLGRMGWPDEVHMGWRSRPVEELELTFQQVRQFFDEEGLQASAERYSEPQRTQWWENVRYILANKVDMVVLKYVENVPVCVPLHPEESMDVMFRPL